MMSAEMPLVPVSQNELQTMAYTDPLTGLGNRYRMRDRVAQISAERASDPAPFTIGIANLDSFKPINDLFGASAGVGFARRCIRPRDAGESLDPREIRSSQPANYARDDGTSVRLFRCRGVDIVRCRRKRRAHLRLHRQRHVSLRESAIVDAPVSSQARVGCRS